MKNVKELAVMIFTASFLMLSLTACFGGGASKNSDITKVVLSGGGMSRSDQYSYSMFVEEFPICCKKRISKTSSSLPLR